MSDFARPASDLFAPTIGEARVTLAPQAGAAFALDPGQTIPLSVIGQSFIFGDGSDGDVVVSGGTTTLARDMYYDNLRVTSSGEIVPAGFRIYVLNTLTIDAGGTINMDASDSSGTTRSDPKATGTGATLGKGGQGAGAAASFAPFNGAPGNTVNPGLGGASGKGGITGVHTGGAAGSVTPPKISPRFLQALPGWTPSGVCFGGAGGGAGGVDGTSSGTPQSGYGGSGGGIVAVSAQAIVNQGRISADGGLGMNGTNDAGAGPDCGGGGGGGGGCIFLTYRSYQGTGVLSVAGGAAGGGINSGNHGDPGSDGNIFQFKINF